MVSTSAAESSARMRRPPNWLELPHELMANILRRLGTLEILNSVWKVCTTWRKICKDPLMWKVIGVDASDVCSTRKKYFEVLIKKAIDLSCGELIEIRFDSFGTNNLLDYILLRSGKLNRLCLKNCRNISNNGLILTVLRLPKLEKLHLSHTYVSVEDIRIMGRYCLHLKSFAMNQEFEGSQNDKKALMIANNMRELRHLQVIGNNMTNVGLKAILNGCPHLESLDVRRCFNVNLSGNLEQLCVERLKDFKRPNDSLENSDDMFLSDYSDVDESL